MTLFFFGSRVSLTYYYLGYYRTKNNLIRIVAVENGDFYQSLIISTFDNNGNLLAKVSPSFEGCTSIPIDFVKCKEIIRITEKDSIVATRLKLVKTRSGRDSLSTTVAHYGINVRGGFF